MQRLRSTTSTQRWLALWVAVALAIRLAFLVASPHPYIEAGLSVYNGDMARNLVDKGQFFKINNGPAGVARVAALQDRARQVIDPAEVDYRQADAEHNYLAEVIEPPGEAAVLAAAWWLTGDERYVYADVLQAVVDAFMVLLVYWLALQLYRRRRAALIAAAMYATFLPLAKLVPVPNLLPWGIDLTIAVTCAFVKALGAERPTRWLVATGVLAGVGMYFRPVILVPLLAALFVWPWEGWRRVVRLAGIPLLVAVLMMVPWTIRNWAEWHRFVPNRTGTGQGLWEGLGELPNDYGAKANDGATLRYVQRRRPDLGYGTPDFDSFLLKQATKEIRREPGHYFAVLGHRLVYATLRFRNPEWTGSAEPLYTYNKRTGKTRWSYIQEEPWDAFRYLVSLLWEPLLLLSALIVAIATRRRWPREHLLLAAVVAGTALPFLALHLEAQYLVPGEFAYIILTALGIDLVAERLAVRQARARPVTQ
jgi:4-amino-4-deoxy-L-arabinose transferase-like glycosyltransferase